MRIVEGSLVVQTQSVTAALVYVQIERDTALRRAAANISAFSTFTAESSRCARGNREESLS
jgi:hypothetical protein